MSLHKGFLTAWFVSMFLSKSSYTARSFRGARRQFLPIAALRQHHNRLLSQCQHQQLFQRPRTYRKSFHRSAHTHVGNNLLDDVAVKEQTMQWLRQVVVGLNLCPFADKPLRQNAIQIAIVRGMNEERILSSVFDELLARTTQPGTTLVVCPECHPDDFESYLYVLDLIETGIIKDDATFEGVVQVAPFHPLFQFEGSEPESVDNWTNRAPFPIFHILREDEVTLAVDRLDGDAGKVWRRNADLIQAMEEDLGSEGLHQVMQGVPLTDQTRIRDLLKRHRIDLTGKKADNSSE
jgi:uncharacterized protein